jgi:antitoxin HicB
MEAILKVPLLLQPQEDGGYTVTSPLLPEFLTEGDTVREALANVPDGLEATLELYDDLGRPAPEALRQPASASPIWFEALVTAG